jgi:hypothetical protein
MSKDRSRRFGAALIRLMLAAQLLGWGARLLASGQVRPGKTELSPKQHARLTSTVDARELPVDQYVRLRNLALSGARARLSPRITNPRVAAYGLDATVLAIFQQQREYLRSRGAVIPGGLLESESLPALCSNPVVAAVNGRTVVVLFTPRAPDNHYRVEGCGFGNKAGEVWLEPDHRDLLSGTAPQPIKVQLDQAASWSDKEIDFHLDPHLSGIADSPVTLVVHLRDGRRAELPGCRFIAVRGQPIPLKTLVASWAKLEATTAFSRPIQQLEYVSPLVGGEELPRDAAGMSALVVRSDPDAFIGAADSYDFSALAPGWVVDGIQIQSYSVTCPGDVTSTHQVGNWNATFDPNGFSVSWASSSCLSFIPPIFRFAMTSSQYAIKIWVVGPAGTEPMRVDFSHNTRKRN